MIDRHIESRVLDALGDTPVVLVIGPRRSGKTTLVRSMETNERTYVTLDDQTTLDAAKADPVGFIRGLGCAVIDEIQRVPELLLAIKKEVDETNGPGRFLLTGSANILTLPRVADSLAGRMETIRMYPLSASEQFGRRSTFLEGLFEGRVAAPDHPVLGDDLVDLVLRGGFPEVIARQSEARRQAWARSYLDSILLKDLQDIAQIERLTELPRFVRLLAHYSAELINYSEIGGKIGIDHKTARRYIGLLEQIFLVSVAAPWHSNVLKQMVKTPKLHFVDSALLAAAKGLTADKVRTDRTAFGPMLESFVYGEVRKQIAANDLEASINHFRDYAKSEVDIVLERADGMLVGIETKASATVGLSDVKGLQKLADATGDRFAYGAVLYDGDRIIPRSDKLSIVPLSCLWQ